MSETDVPPGYNCVRRASLLRSAAYSHTDNAARSTLSRGISGSRLGAAADRASRACEQLEAALGEMLIPTQPQLPLRFQA